MFQSIPALLQTPITDNWDFCTSCNGNGETDRFQVYDSFSLNAASNIGLIEFSVSTGSPSTWPLNSVDVEIFTVNGDLPGSQLFSQTFMPMDISDLSTAPYNTELVSVDPTGLSLSAGSYYISFYSPIYLLVDKYSGGSGQMLQMDLGQVNNRTGYSLDFALFTPTAIPLPGTLPLVATGLGALGLLRWLSKRKARAIAV